MPQEFPGMQVPVPSSSPFSFSVGSSVRPSPGQLGQFTTTTQFQTKTEPGNITSESPINLGQEARKELCESPTAAGVQEDVQKIQENNNNNQSEGESNSEEVTPPKNQGLIKVSSNEQQPGNMRQSFQTYGRSGCTNLNDYFASGSWNLFSPDGISYQHATGISDEEGLHATN